MPRLANMLGATGTVEIEVTGDEPLVVRYRRTSLTPRLQARLMDMQRAATAGDGAASLGGAALLDMCEVYATVIDGWNLTDDDGNVIGTDAASLADVDFGTLNLVMRRIADEVAVDPTNGSGSNSGSSPTADSGPRLITTAS